MPQDDRPDDAAKQPVDGANDAAGSPHSGDRKATKADREARLAEALRANLRRRKQGRSPATKEKE